jgi:hypothetical protein
MPFVGPRADLPVYASYPADTAVVPEDPRRPEPAAEAARSSAIARDAAALEEECQQAAGGDWDRWLRQTAPYRDELRRRVESLKDLDGASRREAELREQPLEGKSGFPLVELGPHEYLPYLYDPGRLDGFVKDRPVVAADRWLRKQGIELIFVPVPKMTEVYVENFVDPCPPDGVIAPHLRRALRDLLKQDVEVVDGWRLFRSLRDPDAEYLYNAAETHWSPRGMRIMAKEVAGRIERYRFSARARYGLPRFATKVTLFETVGERPVLPPQLQTRVDAAQAKTYSEVLAGNGRPPENDPKSPVLLIGNSYAMKFREQLVKELNLPVQSDLASAMTTEAFGDFLRDPQQLAHTRVVVWVMTEYHLTKFKPLPPSIASPNGATE